MLHQFGVPAVTDVGLAVTVKYRFVHRDVIGLYKRIGFISSISDREFYGVGAGSGVGIWYRILGSAFVCSVIIEVPCIGLKVQYRWTGR